MAAKTVLDKNIYQSAMVGGYSGAGATKATTGGVYADSLAGITPPLGGGLNGVKTPTVKMPTNISPISASPISGGATGGVTKEGAIIGGGANNTTFAPYSGGSKAIVGGLGVTKVPTTQAKYSDFLTLNVPNANTVRPAVTTTAAAQDAGAAKQPESDASTTAVPATYEEYLEQQRQLLDKRKAEADRQTEAAKERAAVDAQASYAQNMATYGANAETLAQMGLQGGGYGDYVNAQAYAQKRADVQQANATELAAKAQNTATYEDAISELNKANVEYQEKQREKAAAEEEKKSSIYASLWEGAINPDSGYTAESVASIGKEYGLSDAQITELQGIVSETKAKREAEKQAAIKQAALDAINSGSLTESNIESYLDTLKGQGASDKDIADIRETYQSTYYNDFLAAITNGDESFSTKAVDDAYNAGNLSKEHYDKLKKAWNDDIDTDFFKNVDDYKSAKRTYEELVSNSWCTAETKAALKKSFESYEAKKYASNVSTGYNAHSSTVTLNTYSGKVTVTYGVNSECLKKSSGNAVFQSEIYKNAGSGQVFIVNGRPYVKLDNGDLGWVRDYWGQGAFEELKNTYKGTVYDFS